MKVIAARQRAITAALLTLALGAACFTGGAAATDRAAKTSDCKFSSQLPNDCAGAVETRFDNLRNYRYCEVDLFGEDKNKKILYNNSYNTTGQNGGDQTRDSCAQALFDKLDPEAIKKEYDALFCFSPYVGKLRDFNGLKAPWMGSDVVPKGMDFSKLSSRAYLS